MAGPSKSCPAVNWKMSSTCVSFMVQQKILDTGLKSDIEGGHLDRIFSRGRITHRVHILIVT